MDDDNSSPGFFQNPRANNATFNSWKRVAYYLKALPLDYLLLYADPNNQIVFPICCPRVTTRAYSIIVLLKYYVFQQITIYREFHRLSTYP